MSKTNCCNCGAALDIFAPKCDFCGTKNINITDIDLDSGEAANFIFKLPHNITGADKEVYMSMLAVPILETICTTADTVSIYGGRGSTPLVTYPTSMDLQMNLNLHAVSRNSDNKICCLTIK